MNQKLRMEHDIKVPRDLGYLVTQELYDEGLNRGKTNHEKKLPKR